VARVVRTAALGKSSSVHRAGGASTRRLLAAAGGAGPSGVPGYGAQKGQQKRADPPMHALGAPAYAEGHDGCAARGGRATAPWRRIPRGLAVAGPPPERGDRPCAAGPWSCGPSWRCWRCCGWRPGSCKPSPHCH